MHDDILALWNTSGFEVGRYFLKLEWRELSGAVVYSYYQINLFINTHVEDESGMSVPGKYKVGLPIIRCQRQRIS